MPTSSEPKSPVFLLADDERFWAKVKRSDGCWEWQGYRDRQGYGTVMRKFISPAPMLTHRYSWMLTFGPIPAGLYVCHHCDNPSCVRPDHLFLGTQLANMRDRDRKGRHRPGSLGGEDHPMHKLTWEQVREVRSRPRTRNAPAAWAEELGITRDMLYQILNGHAWKEVA